MTYYSMADMQASGWLFQRLVACAAQEKIVNPNAWVTQHIWELVARDTWVSAWDSALNQANRTKFNPETGQRDDVITDAMVLVAVKEIKALSP